MKKTMVSLGFLGFLIICFCSYVSALLQINQINGPSSVEEGSVDELILDCDFEAQGEEDLVVKWFFNGLEEQIYQWIVGANESYASGQLKELIDTRYRFSDRPESMFRAIRFLEVDSRLSGNFTCKVGSDKSDQWKMKQVIIYSPATSFNIVLIEGDDHISGDEVLLCDAVKISPKPDFELYISRENGSLSELPETLHANKTETYDEDGFYNVSITLPFNSSFLEDGTTKFLCQLSIPGTNYSEFKTVEHTVETQISPPSTELYPDVSILYSNFSPSFNNSEEILQEDNGIPRLQSSLLSVLFVIITLVWAT